MGASEGDAAALDAVPTWRLHPPRRMIGAMENPLLRIVPDAPFDRIDASHVEPAIDELLARASAAVDAIASDTSTPTYENTLGALEAATETLEWAGTLVGHLESVATTDALRDAYNRIQPKTSAFYSGIPLNDGLYRRLHAFAETDAARALDPTRKRLLDKTLFDFRRHGAELSPEKKRELSAIDVELAEKTTKFSQNVLDATNAFELVITDEARLAGLPPSAVAAAKASAESKGKAGYRFTLHQPSLVPVLTYADDRALRETLWHASNVRASSGELDNRPLMARIVELRKAKATLLGFADFADFVLADRMAKNGATAVAFVEDLHRRTIAAFERENRELDEFRRGLGAAHSFPMQPWDVPYYAEKMRKALYDFDDEELRPYFAADQVLRGLFGLCERLYGIEVRERQAPTWDPSVRTFGIVDEGGAMMASFYVDLHPRENKRGGAWMNPIRSNAADGERLEPHVGLFCSNATPPIGDAPALLSHDEVETLFHEFGHLLHHALAKVSVRSLSGTNVAWDFVELPSQIMENWCWEREALDRFARHHETGAPIPEELFRKMTRARTFRAANFQMRQLGFAATDLYLHTRYEPSTDGPIVDVARRILGEHSAAPLPQDYAMICGFTHLFASPVGYAAGYYSYKWAEVLDADCFTRFQREGIDSPVVGHAFRDAILSRGDSEDPELLFERFMGRKPSLDALMARQGLLEAA